MRTIQRWREPIWPGAARRSAAGALIAVVAFASCTALPSSRSGHSPACPDARLLEVSGANLSQSRCLDDLTTFTNPYTDTSLASGAGTRENGSLHSRLTRFPERKVPGVQVEGWFPDSCDHREREPTPFIPTCAERLRHNGQFLIRVPNNWDGVHLIVAGTPGVRNQFASDIILSDWVVLKGWAYASQDKGNTGINFFRAGDDETGDSRDGWIPGRAVEQWATSMQRTAAAAKALLTQAYGRPPRLTYAAGISNGGYQVRLALERYPELFEGGVDWEGVLWTADGPNLLTYLPTLVRHYPAHQHGDPDAYWALVDEGHVSPGSESTWEFHYPLWALTQSMHRPAFDPEYAPANPSLVVAPQDPDATYDYSSRPQIVKDRVASVANTGDLHGRPLLTLHGTLDTLLPIIIHSDIYAQLVRERGQAGNFRYYRIEGGNHFDRLAESHPELIRPILPCFLAALDALDHWVTTRQEPPSGGTIPFPVQQSPEERANTCTLGGS